MREPEHAISANFLSPHPLHRQGLLSHRLRRFCPLQHTRSTQYRCLHPHPATTVVTTTDSYIPNTFQNSVPGVTWDSRCSPRPRGARGDTRCVGSAFISRDQVQSTNCPCETAGKPHRSNSTPAEFYCYGPTIILTVQVHPF